MSDDLLKQVQSEMRAETAMALARRHAALCGAILILGIVGLGVWQWHRHTVQKAVTAASAAYYQATMQLLQPDSPTDTQKAIAVMKGLSHTAPGQIRFYAAIQLAEAHIQANDFKSAATVLDSVAGDRAAEPFFQSYARYVRLNAAASMHVLPEDEIRAGYEALARDGGAWKPYAQEGLLATDLSPDASAARRVEARQLAEGLAGNPEVPNSIRQRAATVSSILKAQSHD